MAMKFTIPTESGDFQLTSQQLAQQIGQRYGMVPVGITADGASGIFQTPQGTQVIPFHEVLSKDGYEIADFAPENAQSVENVSKYRAGIEGFSDPDMQTAYLQTIARKDFGVESPQIVGKGSDRYLYLPDKMQWVNLTNKQGMDMSDVVGGGMALGRGAASVAGGVLGGAGAATLAAPTGPGAIAAGIAGGGLGSAAGSALADSAYAGGLSLMDPAFREVASQNKGALAAGIGKNALVSGLIGGATGGAGAAFKGLATPISSALSSTGRGASAVGGGVEAVGAGLGSPVGRFGMQMGLDPTGISGAGALGGFAKEIASPIAQGGVRAFDAVRGGLAAIRGMPAPSPLAGQTFAETAQAVPNIGKFVRGVEALGGAAEKVGRGFETGVSGTLRGVGLAGQGVGKGLQTVGNVGARGGETLAYQTAAQNRLRELDAPRAAMDGRTFEAQGMPAGYIPIQQQGLDAVQQANLRTRWEANPTLMDAIIARGGL
jgi:hypothetical protein